MDIIDIYNYKSYKHLSQEIYNILYYNNEKYTVTNSYILCSYSKLSIKSKNEINDLFITHNNDVKGWKGWKVKLKVIMV